MTTDNQPRFRALPLVLMVLVLAALAAGGWWLKSRPTNPIQNTAGVLAPIPSSNNIPPQHVSITLYLPNANAMLEKHVVEANVSQHFKPLAKKAIALMMEKSPDNFPTGTKLLDVETGTNDVATINFNENFTDNSFWQGSARTMMTVYSIVNTIADLSADDFNAQKVKIVVNGESPEVLGALEVNDPLTPDMQLVAQP